MGTEAIERTEKRLGRRPPAGFCYFHAVKPRFWLELVKAKRCGATCSGKRRPERRGMPCLAFALKGKRRCRVHGGRNGGKRTPKYSPEVREARKRAAVLESDRLWALQLAKEAKPKPVIWPSESSFHSERSLEDEFRSHHRKRDRGWTPYWPFLVDFV